MNDMVSKRNRWKAAIGVVVAIPLLVGGCASSSEKADEPAAEQTTQAADEGFVGVGANGESQNLFPDNGVKNDGYGAYLQSTVADDDPALKFARNLVDPNVWNGGYTEEQITAGQAAIVRFIATEGIDSTLRAPHNEDNQQVWDEWVAANRDQISDFVKLDMDGKSGNITPDDFAINGWPNGDPSGTPDWKTETPFEYQYGEDKMRMVSRTIVPGSIKLLTEGYPANEGVQAFLFEGKVSYGMRATINGAEGIESDEAKYEVFAELTPDGEWKIYNFTVTSLIGY